MASNLLGFAPIMKTPGQAASPLETLHEVPAGKEQTILMARATNRTSTDATITLGIRLPGTAEGTEKMVAFNVPIKVGAPQNVFGPDVLGPLPAGTKIVGRASSANTIDLVMTGTERTI